MNTATATRTRGRVPLKPAKAARTRSRVGGPLQMATPPRSTVWTGRRKLTAREVQVLELVSHGKTNHEIAAALDLTPYTVMSHLCRMYARADTASRAAMVTVGFRWNLLHPEPLPPGTPPLEIDAALLELLPLIAAGYSNAQIACRLLLSIDAVKTRLQRLRKALRARSRAHMVRRAVEYGLLDPHALTQVAIAVTPTALRGRRA